MYFKYKLILALLLFLFLLTYCGDSNPTGQEGDSDLISKSSKRGISYNLLNEKDLNALKPGVSWWYNWFFRTNAPDNYYTDYQMEFIPMLWGGNSQSDYLQAKDFILAHPEIKYLLVLNEPNLTDQANQTPFEAAAIWVKYEQIVSELESQNREIFLVGPAMNWGTMTDYWDPVVWLDAFYNAYRNSNNGKDPRIDYLAFHWYDYGLDSQLDRLQKYGKKIWITEMANWNSQINSYSKQADQMKQMVALCENRDDVFRYAWFIGRGAENRYSNLFNTTPGELNDLGKLYISLPYAKKEYFIQLK